MRSIVKPLLPAFCLVILSVGPKVFSQSGGVHAQSAGVNALLEEVVVTARKREEGLQDAPIAISVFTGESLEYRGVTNIGEIAEFTPNLTFQNNPSFGGSSNAASVYLRGYHRTWSWDLRGWCLYSSIGWCHPGFN